MSFLGVPEGSVTDVEDLAGGDVGGLGANLGCKLVDDSGIGESASRHDLIVSSARTVGVEVWLLHVLGEKVASSGRIFGDVSGGRDVVGGDGVSEAAEDVGCVDVVGLGEGKFG